MGNYDLRLAELRFESVLRYLQLAEWTYHQNKLNIQCDQLVAQKLTGQLFYPLKLYFNYPWEIYINDRLVWHRNVAYLLGRVGKRKLVLPLLKSNDRLGV